MYAARLPNIERRDSGPVHRDATADPEVGYEAAYVRPTPAEQVASTVATAAHTALTNAIATYERTGFGVRATQPLRDALKFVEYSIREVQS